MIINMDGSYLFSVTSVSIVGEHRRVFSWMLCSHGFSWTPDSLEQGEQTESLVNHSYVARWVKNKSYTETVLSFLSPAGVKASKFAF